MKEYHPLGTEINHGEQEQINEVYSQVYLDTSRLLALSSNDVPFLIKEYNTFRRLQDKRNIARALSYIGGDKVIKLFVNNLTNNYSGVIISTKDEEVLFDLVRDLGILAKK
jgi:hypothetical protein